MNQINKLILFFGICIVFSSCYKDDYLNPSQASNESVIKDVNGLISLCNGLQSKYSVGRTSPIYASITASGLSTGELLVYNQGNTDEAALSRGKADVNGSNAVVTRLWEQSLLTISNADLILKNLEFVKDENTNKAIRCYAHLYKGLALLQLGTYWEQAPIATGKSATFTPRQKVLEEAAKLFEEGIGVVPPATAFTGAYVGGIDFVNTFNALAARTNVMLGNFDKALDQAGKVDLTKKSEFIYDAVSRNPIFDVHYNNVNVCGPIDGNLGLKGDFIPVEADARVLHYLKSKTFDPKINPGKGFFTANDARIPIYLTGEMLLIKAEALARKNDLTGAIAELNKVLTKATDVFNVTAKLPEYNGAQTQDAVLKEIYKNRCIELYNSGLKLEDSRRFGIPKPGDAGSDRSRNFYPYPNSERDNNPNTPPDPAI